ncbi:MAG: hypothetical protein U0411_13290 [Thermodesulfovibrionales bacterium]
MDEETLEYIFITFEVDDSGTVLHIPIAKRITEGYSDTITISGGEGRGARAVL